MEETQKPSQADMAAHDYGILIEKFRSKVRELSGRSLQRAVVAMMEYPFETEKPRFSYPQERELFYLGMQLNDCRFVLMRTFLDMKEEELKSLAAEGGTAVTEADAVKVEALEESKDGKVD